MQLRNGKIINATKSKLVCSIKSKLINMEKVPCADVPSRISAAHDIYLSIFDNIDYILSPEFDATDKFITTVYNKTFILGDDAYFLSQTYIETKKPRNSRAIRQEVDNFCHLLTDTRNLIETKRPHIRPPHGYGYDDYKRSFDREDYL